MATQAISFRTGASSGGPLDRSQDTAWYRRLRAWSRRGQLGERSNVGIGRWTGGRV